MIKSKVDCHAQGSVPREAGSKRDAAKRSQLRAERGESGMQSEPPLGNSSKMQQQMSVKKTISLHSLSRKQANGADLQGCRLDRLLHCCWTLLESTLCRV